MDRPVLSAGHRRQYRPARLPDLRAVRVSRAGGAVWFVVLVGLAAKNAILIVEFARDIELEGKSRLDAVIEACRLRLRPILMTSFAFILGVLPLVISTGSGSEMRQAVGV